MSEPSRTVLAPESEAPRGEWRTWDWAFQTYYIPLCEYVLRIVGSADAAQDVVQEVFARLWSTRRPDEAAARLTRPYLFAAARNGALKYLRHRRVVEKWIERAEREEPPAADTPEDLCLRHELDDAVTRAIADLPERRRAIFLLRRRDHLSYQAIAARLGVSLGTVKSQMWRAAMSLKEKLAPHLR